MCVRTIFFRIWSCYIRGHLSFFYTGTSTKVFVQTFKAKIKEKYQESFYIFLWLKWNNVSNRFCVKLHFLFWWPEPHLVAHNRLYKMTFYWKSDYYFKYWLLFYLIYFIVIKLTAIFNCRNKDQWSNCLKFYHGNRRLNVVTWFYFNESDLFGSKNALSRQFD